MPRPKKQPSPCIVREPVACERPASRRGMCEAHYRQSMRSGGVTIIRDRGSPRVMLPWRVPEYVVDAVRQVAADQERDPAELVAAALLALVPEGD